MSRSVIHAHSSFGERAADVVVSGMGSWRFVIIQSVVVALWILANVILLSRPFDSFPFILLNLAFSTQAAYASPLILMASNRQAAKDRKRDDLESEEVELLVTLVQSLVAQSAYIKSINERQLEILTALHELQSNLKESV